MSRSILWPTHDPLLGPLRDAVQIATEASRAYLEGECILVRRDGEEWWDTTQADRYSDAWRLHTGFLRARHLIEHNMAEPHLVRVKPTP